MSRTDLHTEAAIRTSPDVSRTRDGSWPSVCLAIVNYNGVGHLEHLMPTVVEALDAYEGEGRAIVLDNQSTENDRAWIEEHYPQDTYPRIEFVEAPGNDYLYSYNWLVSTLDEEIVILLNNDLRLDRAFIAPLVRHFEAPDVFSVSSKAWNWDGSEVTTGPVTFTFHRGHFFIDIDTERQETAYSLFSVGGFMAVDRRKYLELGGFHPLFYPAYGEDLEICYRAWLRGWTTIYEPESVCWHRVSGSIKERAAFMNLRSAYLFEMAFVRDWRTVAQRSLYYAARHFLLAPRSLSAKAFRSALALWVKRKGRRLARESARTATWSRRQIMRFIAEETPPAEFSKGGGA